MNEDKAARYHRLRRRTSLLEHALATSALFLLLATGWSAALRDWAMTAAGQSTVLAVALYVLCIALLVEALQLPLAFYQGAVLERRYELSTQAASRWWMDRFKALLVGLPLLVVMAVIVWGLLRWSPDHWWYVASACFAATLVLLAHLAPVWLLPLFSRCEPLQRPTLSRRLVTLAERAGTQVLGVFEWHVSDRTRKANAALAGIGRTRRILLSDTLLAEHSDDEVEVIVAHELAHHVHHDIWRAMAFESGLTLLGFYLADRMLGVAVGHFGVTAKFDVAALPLLVLTGGAVSLAFLPLVNAVSRVHERRADRYALDLTGNPAAFTSAMKRLSARNLAEERPSRWVEVLFYRHPSIADRLDAAHAWDLARGSRTR